MVIYLPLILLICAEYSPSDFISVYLRNLRAIFLPTNAPPSADRLPFSRG
jgi:hypothetical protein